MKIAVDFDGVIIKHKTVPTRKNWWKDEPMPLANDVIRYWIRQGHEVYVFTARNKNEQPIVGQWMYDRGFPILRITNTKEEGTDIFIDDRAIRFTNWMDLSKLIK